MSSSRKLISIKIIHTAIWIFYNIVIFYMLYAVIRNEIGIRFWICSGLVLLEGIVLLIFKWTCPLTILARRYTTSTADNFDIYLPNWLAKYTKTIYTSLTVLILILAICRLLAGSWL